MSGPKQYPVETTILMDGETMNELIRNLSREIAASVEDIESLVLLGILRRGVPLAERLAAQIKALRNFRPPVGALATTLYRDDRSALVRSAGVTQFDFDVSDKTVLLVDDVLAAGRTIRAAMDEIMDYGRPSRIQLACLIDRGGRELPIQPDYHAYGVATGTDEWVAVRMQEVDEEDMVLIERYPAPEIGPAVEDSGE